MWLIEYKLDRMTYLAAANYFDNNAFFIKLIHKDTDMKNRKTISSFLIYGLFTLFFFASCGGGGEESASPISPTTPTSTSAAVYTLSDEQVKITGDNGLPEYLTISVNAEAGKREESWIYTKLGKMYIYWDGTRVQEQDIIINPNDYSNPPYIDPQLFDDTSQKTDIQKVFGSDFTLIDQSAGSLSFVTWYYENLGLIVSFLDDDLASVQTVDLP